MERDTVGQKTQEEISSESKSTRADKWFLKIDPNNKDFPPAHRFTGSTLSPFTTKNTVVPLIDGALTMGTLYDHLILMMGEVKNNKLCELWIANWTISKEVKLQGEVKDAKDLETLFKE